MLKRLSCLLLIFISGCIDPINFKFDEQVEHLVVEARFTNSPEENYVRLMISQPYDSPYNKFEKNAVVYVSNEEGDFIPFFYAEAGYYYPVEAGHGTIGETYTLHIEREGKSYQSSREIYQSSPVKLLEPVAIDSIYFEYDEQYVVIKGEREKKFMPGYNVMIDYNDPGDETNFYRWSYRNLYEVHTQPQDHMEQGCISCPRPDPKSCCAVCWINEAAEMFTVSNDRLSNGKKVIRRKLFFIPFEKYLNVKYKLSLYQHAITEEAYNFFQAIEQQSGSTGTIFDPPPSEIKGNIYNVNDPNEQVIGIFDASSVAVKEITILGKDIPHELPKFIYPDDCLELENSTTERPEGW